MITGLPVSDSIRAWIHCKVSCLKGQRDLAVYFIMLQLVRKLGGFLASIVLGLGLIKGDEDGFIIKKIIIYMSTLANPETLLSLKRL